MLTKFVRDARTNAQTLRKHYASGHYVGGGIKTTKFKHLHLVFIVAHNEFPVKKWNTLKFNELVVKSMREHAGHPAGDKYCHHDRQHVRQVVR